MRSPLFRLGVIVPPANPTVEPELTALMPRGVAMHVARLPVLDRDLRERLAAYPTLFSAALQSFGELRLDCALIGVTGATYALGEDGDRQHCAALAVAHGLPVGAIATASITVIEALRALGCQRIALLSPYPAWLTEQSVAYWRSANFEVVQVDVITEKDDPVPGVGDPNASPYNIAGQRVAHGLDRLAGKKADAILVAGTGLASLDAIAAMQGKTSVPVLSSNICGAWWATTQLGVEPANTLKRIAPHLAACGR